MCFGYINYIPLYIINRYFKTDAYINSCFSLTGCELFKNNYSFGAMDNVYCYILKQINCSTNVDNDDI